MRYMIIRAAHIRTHYEDDFVYNILDIKNKTVMLNCNTRKEVCENLLPHLDAVEINERPLNMTTYRDLIRKYRGSLLVKGKKEDDVEVITLDVLLELTYWI